MRDFWCCLGSPWQGIPEIRVPRELRGENCPRVQLLILG